MKLFYGTGNQSKLRNMRAILAGMPIELVTPADLGIQLPAVEETGATPLENAALKAEAFSLSVFDIYCQELQKPTQKYQRL